MDRRVGRKTWRRIRDDRRSSPASDPATGIVRLGSIDSIRYDEPSRLFEPVIQRHRSTEAQSHPIWKLLEDPEQNRAALVAMPRFTGTNLISRVKPAATLLGRTSSPLSRVGIMPVFACETFGRGRTFAMSTDTTQAWGRYFESQWGEGDNRYYRKFWRNVIRWLAENSRASQRRLIVHTDQVIYSPGEPIQVVAEAFDRDFRSTTDYRVTARLVSADSPAREMRFDGCGRLPPWSQSVAERYAATIPGEP